MLIEMTSPVFKEKGKTRPPIHFKDGLNVVLGKEDGENSIGKSSALLAIDFVFGGDTYLLRFCSMERNIILQEIQPRRKKFNTVPRVMN